MVQPHSQPMTEAVKTASELARGTVPSKAMGHLEWIRPSRQNWHSWKPPLACEKPPRPRAEMSVAATCMAPTLALVARSGILENRCVRTASR